MKNLSKDRNGETKGNIRFGICGKVDVTREKSH